MSGSDARERAESLASLATVAVLTALPVEQAAMQLMLDGPVQYSTPGNAPGEYWLGTVPSTDGREHVVVLGPCSVGENLAAANATILFERFSRIETVIMVGIAGAVPDPTKPEEDVHLGDVVVCNGDGVVQYDYDKEVLKAGGVTSEPRHPPRPPSSRLAAAAEELRSGAMLNRRPWEEYFARADDFSWARRPTTPDELHSHETPERKIERLADPDRARGRPRIFSGRIASGNKLLKNAKLRERLRCTFGVRAVEMEASGVADASWLQRAGYFVVRGTCDYCDEYKNDAWQGYAAMIASAYTRALLEQTRASTPVGPGSATTDDATAAIESLPVELRDAVTEATRALGTAIHARSALRDLIAAEEKSHDPFDAAWPSNDPWARSVATCLGEELRAYGAPLKPGEVLLAAAMPYFISAVQHSTIRTRFGDDADEAAWIRAYSELLAANPAAETLLARNLPAGSKQLALRWAILRLTIEQRPWWSDATFRSHSPDVALARWLAADPLIPTLARVIAGNVEQFESLPETGAFRFAERSFEVRWRLLACFLTLAELRVVGVHLLSPDVIEHVAQLPDVQSAVQIQFQQLAIQREPDSTWVLRATCDEPVLDHAIAETAGRLDKELRSVRARLSNYLSLSLQGRGFPSVRSDVHPRLAEGRPRYTTPHVKFAMAPEHARRLFMGSDLWGDPSFAFRELFQNALDACRYRAARSAFLDIAYVPSIRMFHGKASDGREYVECEDNGIGMDRDIVASCFAMAGRRFVNMEAFRREKEAWREKGIEIHTNSQFGIGVFSYFLVADELEVETARLGHSGEAPAVRLSLRVPTAAAFFRIVTLSEGESRVKQRERAEERGDKPLSFPDAGTRVRLWLRPEKDSEHGAFNARVGCVDAIREHVWFSEVDVEVRDYRGQRYQIAANQLAPWLLPATEAPGGDSRFWWINDATGARPGRRPETERLTTFRSRRRGRGAEPEFYEHHGRVLVDGIATDATTPGFILNLTGNLTPKLSLDRRKLREDIREQVGARVDHALAYLPHDIPGALLQDLWLWDPRACHKAARVVTERKTGWLRGASYRPLAQAGSPERTQVPFMPQVPNDSSFMIRDYRDSLLSLWKLARWTPDARMQNAVILEARGVESNLRSHLANVPKRIWDAWAGFDLGVPEACALLYGLSLDKMAALPAFMSWLTGETVASCLQRMATLREVLDLDWTAPNGAFDFVLSDHDAWLLGRGQFSTPWRGPIVTSIDLLIFSRNSGKGLDEGYEAYSSLAERLGWTFDCDREFAKGIGSLTQEEVSYAVLLQHGWTRGWPSEGLSDERKALLARLVGVEQPKDRRLLRAVKDEHEKVLLDAVLKALGESRDLKLSGLCEVARALGRSVIDLAANVRGIASELEIECRWTDQEVLEASNFSDADWAIAEHGSPWGEPRIVRPRTKIELAALLAIHSYHFGWESNRTENACRRIEAVYSVFGWGPSPLTAAGVDLALGLDREDGLLLADAPSSAVFSIPRLLVKSVTSGVPLERLAAVLQKLASLGVRGPSADDRFLGVTWAEAVGPILG